MRNLRFGRCLSSLVCLLAFTSGCQVLYRYRPVPVLVRDAETKKPIAEVQVHLSYPLSRDSLAPFDSEERTGADGIAHLKAAPYGDFGVRVEASVAGYLSEQTSLSTEVIKSIKPASFFPEKERNASECVLEMYAEPRFTVELIVPVGYRGLIKADVSVEENLPAPPGQRCYRYEVKEGSVIVKAPAVLRRIDPPEYRASYSDGKPLSSEMTLSNVGFRWLRCEGQLHYFVVGTQPEYDMLRRSILAEEAASKPRSAPSSRNGGHGGRHRGGGD